MILHLPIEASFTDLIQYNFSFEKSHLKENIYMFKLQNIDTIDLQSTSIFAYLTLLVQLQTQKHLVTSN